MHPHSLEHNVLPTVPKLVNLRKLLLFIRLLSNNICKQHEWLVTNPPEIRSTKIGNPDHLAWLATTPNLASATDLGHLGQNYILKVIYNNKKYWLNIDTCETSLRTTLYSQFFPHLWAKAHRSVIWEFIFCSIWCFPIY